MNESLHVLWDVGDRVFCRGWRPGADGERRAVLIMLPAGERPSPATLGRLAHYYELKDELDGAWAVRPLELVREQGRTMLALEDPGGAPLARLLGAPMDLGRFLRLAIGIAGALGKVHRRGLVHKDLKPAHILVNCADGQARLTGFGIASRLPRERQALEPPETIAGTLAYMAPEQTGRMNRSIDSRSDLYSLGVTFYQMLTGSLPFAASDPMEWVHCHIARRPAPPGERINVPAPISQIIMKLLAKTAEERYQTAAGVERDLRRCQADWECQRRIDDFRLGQRDTPDRLLIPEKLYGRELELEILLSSFDRVVKGGAPELALVSGYSGIGKSSVVNGLHKALVPPRGLFASGKFDQYKRDIPYSTLAQAFQSLIRRLLGKSDAELALWRDAFLEALEPNARLMTDLIPELKLIIGDQPVAELEPQQAQSRFRLVFRRFIGVFAQPDHPLALFLDDLQWLDAATLDLLGDLLTQSEVRRLMLIGAYRDNEVDATHPLTRKLDAIRQAGAQVQEIRLAPLARKHLGQLIADALHCEPERAAPLAQLVHEKTAGNPFFVVQFFYALAEEGLLRFDHDAACWSWDLDRIHDKGYADNVADLMVGKLTRLPVDTQQALQQLACLGNVAETAMLAIILEIPEEQARAALWPAVRQELVERLKGSYKFIHDRVQEAAYSLIPEELRAEVHLRIGRLLAAQTPPEKREEAIFEIVNQLNRGAVLITEQEERDQVAELNLIAGKRAKEFRRLRLGAHLSQRRRRAVGRGLLGAPPRTDVPAGAEPGRMRIPHWRSGSRGRAVECAFSPRRNDHGARLGRLPAAGPIDDARSERPRRCRWPRISPAFGGRMVAASDRRGRAMGIRAVLGATREPHDRGSDRVALDDRSSIARDDGRSDQDRSACIHKLKRKEPRSPHYILGGKSQPRAGQQRRFVLRLCNTWHDRRRAVRRLRVQHIASGGLAANWPSDAVSSASKPGPI